MKYNAQIKHLKGKLSELCGVSFRLRIYFKVFEAAKNMYNSCMYSVISYCVEVRGRVSHCKSRCNVFNIIRMRKVKNLF